ncbi:hypothetical protein FPOAC1_011155 [Fusarium poae]|uniref:hypothetical protein n=1 Tax=Fusarium poae TaxID=36050 RepID=UPI001CE77809|nr:hypothetical protein FPOAC1_011155 [Fusarium poae]KAG8666350.1 hypothetical protein FPOAC1_011155 [Fusarium poae]
MPLLSLTPRLAGYAKRDGMDAMATVVSTCSRHSQLRAVLDSDSVNKRRRMDPSHSTSTQYTGHIVDNLNAHYSGGFIRTDVPADQANLPEVSAILQRRLTPKA